MKISVINLMQKRFFLIIFIIIFLNITLGFITYNAEISLINKYISVYNDSSPDIIIVFPGSLLSNASIKKYFNQELNISRKYNIIFSDINITYLYAFPSFSGDKAIITLIPSHYRYHSLCPNTPNNKNEILVIPILNNINSIKYITLVNNKTYQIKYYNETNTQILNIIRSSILLASKSYGLDSNLPIVIACPSHEEYSETFRNLLLFGNPLFVIKIADIVPVVEKGGGEEFEPLNYKNLDEYIKNIRYEGMLAYSLIPEGVFDAILADGFGLILNILLIYMTSILLVSALAVRSILRSKNVIRTVKALLALGFTPGDISRPFLILSASAAILSSALLWSVVSASDILIGLSTDFNVLKLLFTGIVITSIVILIIYSLFPYTIAGSYNWLRPIGYNTSLILVVAIVALLIFFGRILSAYAYSILALSGAAVVLAMDSLVDRVRWVTRLIPVLTAKLVDISLPLMLAGVLALFLLQPVVIAYEREGVFASIDYFGDANRIEKIVLSKEPLNSKGEGVYIVTNCIVGKINNLSLVEVTGQSDQVVTGRTYEEVPVVIIDEGVARLLNISEPTLYLPGTGPVSLRLRSSELENVRIYLFSYSSPGAGWLSNETLSTLRVLKKPCPLWITYTDPQSIAPTMLTAFLEYNGKALVLPVDLAPKGCRANLIGVVNPREEAALQEGLVVDYESVREEASKALHTYAVFSLTPLVTSGLLALVVLTIFGWVAWYENILNVRRQLLALGFTGREVLSGEAILAGIASLAIGAVYMIVFALSDLSILRYVLMVTVGTFMISLIIIVIIHYFINKKVWG